MKRKNLLKRSGIIHDVVIIISFLVIAMSYAFDHADLQKLKTTNSFPKCDLSGANRSESHLDNAPLTDAVWTDGTRCKAGSMGECKK